MAEFIRIDGLADPVSTRAVGMRCPACHRNAMFEPVGNQRDIVTQLHGSNTMTLGQRMCPGCNCHVFIVMSQGGLFVSYPAERIDFDASSIPAKIIAVFEEALGCHANEFYVASAMLVRKTLETLCDERGAKGKDLKDRIADLRRIVILPEALFQALDRMRLLGNDAAHVEAKTYTEIGKDEIEAAIALTKEILKAVYQYNSLLAKLDALKK
jgi:hypothetical protein